MEARRGKNTGCSTKYSRLFFENKEGTPPQDRAPVVHLCSVGQGVFPPTMAAAVVLFLPRWCCFTLSQKILCYQIPWRLEDRVRAVKLFLREGTTVAAQRAFRREPRCRRAPERRTLLRWVEEFEAQGSVRGAASRSRGAPVSQWILATIKRAIRRNPRISVRRLAARAGATPTTVHRVLRFQLKLFPL